MAKIINILVVLIISLFLVAGCTTKSGSPTTTLPDVPETAEENKPVDTPMPVPTEGNEDVQETIVQEVKEFDLVAKKWEFVPSTITVNQGDKVILHVTSADVEHGIGLSEFGISTKNIVPGKTTDIEFIADKKGEFSFKCNVFCGSGHSDMKGMLIVK